MKTFFVFYITACTLVAAADPGLEQRLAAERARREYYQLVSQIQAMQKQADAKAAEANKLIDDIKSACDAQKGTLDGETLTCKPKPEAK